MSMPPPPWPPSDGVPHGGYPSDPGYPGYPGSGGHPGYGGYSGYAYEHPEGTTVLVLGVLSLVVCQFLGPVAWIMGNNVIAEIDRNPGMYSNRGSVQAGRICGIISSCLIIVMVVGFVLALIALGASAA